MRRFIAVLFFLMLAEDGGALYRTFIWAPLAWAHTVFFEALPIKVRAFDLIMLLILLLGTSTRDAKGPRVPPVKRALLLSAGTTTVWFIYGLASGGDARAGSWQVYLMLSSVLFAFTVAATFRLPEHFVLLGKALFAASMYRASMCVIFYFTHIRTNSILPPPEYLTSHEDTIKWVATLAMLGVYVFETRSRAGRVWALFAVPLILAAIQLNNRRLAWVSLAVALIVTLVLIRPSKTKQRLKRTLLLMAPIVLLYVAVGWGRNERIFKPLRAFATVSTQEDASTKARNVENLGLIHTGNTTSWLIGTGWGHGYKELSLKYNIDSFALWRYVPHNSVLGLLAYSGMLGFMGYWMIFPTAAFVNVRTARLAKRPLERTVAVVAMANMVIVANQMYGDMGLFSNAGMYLLGTSYAAAMRIPLEAGTWPSAAITPNTRSPKVPAGAA